MGRQSEIAIIKLSRLHLGCIVLCTSCTGNLHCPGPCMPQSVPSEIPEPDRSCGCDQAGHSRDLAPDVTSISGQRAGRRAERRALHFQVNLQGKGCVLTLSPGSGLAFRVSMWAVGKGLHPTFLDATQKFQLVLQPSTCSSLQAELHRCSTIKCTMLHQCCSKPFRWKHGPA